MKRHRKEMDVNDIMYGFRKKGCIWMSDHAKDVTTGFSEEDQDALYELEDVSWWFRYRADVIFHMAEKYLSSNKITLDVGGGNGYTTLRMQEKGYCIALLEPSFQACKNAKQRGIHTVICGTLTYEDVKECSVMQFMLLDVLEHIEDDLAFLKLVKKQICKGGRILITVPAYRILWSSEDDAAGHYRRYTVKELKILAERADFRVCYVSYFFSFLFLPILFFRVGLEKIGLLKYSGERTKEEKLEKNSSRNEKVLYG